MALASLVLGVIGLMFRYKLCAWLAVFACLGSIANMRKRDFDYKQVATSLLSDRKRKHNPRQRGRGMGAGRAHSSES